MRTVLIFLIRIYQSSISALFPPVCKYVPSCSEYAVESIRKYGALRGGARAVYRILRCNPLSRGGHDPA
ncbi:MAG: membrane protein insertion efficiency factor YidD [bacterium]